MSNSLTKSTDLTPKPLLTISGHEHYVTAIAYLPKEKRLVTCSEDETVRIWNVENGEQEGASMGHDGWARGLAVTKDGKTILSGGKDKLLRIWDVETHQPIAEWGACKDRPHMEL
ncbi:WD40 repeat-like protein [Paxillus ammoniavirescens]|nr:WD40 repeat-like protein [Paxillus ammoniavirescens]